MARIMLVDDDLDLSNLTKMALMKKGYSVVVCYNAKEAMDEAIRQKPDLILMDIMLPGVGGEEAVQKLRKDPNSKNIPVIFLTGLVSNEEEKTGINIEGVIYKTLGKPYEIEKLLEMVGNVLRA